MDDLGGRGVGKRRGRSGRSPDGREGPAARVRAPRKTVGERLDEGSLTPQEASELARERLLRILAAGPKSRRELEASMGRKGYPEHVVAPLLDRFGEVGLVDDAEYAQMVVRTRHAERGLARRAIAAELRRRGIDDDTAVEALEIVGDEDERETVTLLAAKLIARTRGLDRDTRVRRAVSALARKGYGPGLAFGAVRDALAADGEELDDAACLG